MKDCHHLNRLMKPAVLCIPHLKTTRVYVQCTCKYAQCKNRQCMYREPGKKRQWWSASGCPAELCRVSKTTSQEADTVWALPYFLVGANLISKTHYHTPTRQISFRSSLIYCTFFLLILNSIFTSQASPPNCFCSREATEKNKKSQLLQYLIVPF